MELEIGAQGVLHGFTKQPGQDREVVGNDEGDILAI